MLYAVGSLMLGKCWVS